MLLITQRGEQFAFTGDAALQGDVLPLTLQAVAQGMSPPRFRVALDERLVIRIQENHVQRHALGPQAGENARQVVQVAGRAHVDGDGHALQTGFLGAGDELMQKPHGQVVDAGISRVFQHPQGDRLAGAGDPGDEHDIQHGGRAPPLDGASLTGRPGCFP
ncbi:hypothetical protein CDEF62S_05788 [Castellaniella defragrans]